MNYEQLTDDELNKEVSEKVMGWEVAEDWRGKYWIIQNGILARTTVYDSYCNHWQPATSIAQAVEVVERFNGYEIIKSTTEPTLKYRVRLWFDSQGKTTGFIWDKSLPRAICIASLKAVEAKEGKE